MIAYKWFGLIDNNIVPYWFDPTGIINKKFKYELDKIYISQSGPGFHSYLSRTFCMADSVPDLVVCEVELDDISSIDYNRNSKKNKVIIAQQFKIIRISKWPN